MKYKVLVYRIETRMMAVEVEMDDSATSGDVLDRAIELAQDMDFSEAKIEDVDHDADFDEQET